MPRSTHSRLVAACALALLIVLSTAGAAMAKKGVDLRVVGANGKVLAEKSIVGENTSVATSPKATCFGKGTGGSGKAAKIGSGVALGVLAKAAKSTAALRPLLISDAFDFGLALCGIGGNVASMEGSSWFLKVNHKDPGVGADTATVKPGSEVLFAYAPYPYPDELGLSAPDRVAVGKPFKVRVLAYSLTGKSKPVAGVTVTGASSPTGADGRTTVVLQKQARLIARHSSYIPSNREAVCVGGKCPRG